MRRMTCAVMMAIALAIPTARLAGQGPMDLKLSLDKLPAGTKVQAETGGKIVPRTTATATAGPNGALEMALAIGSAGKLEATFDAQFDVYVGDCPDKSVRVYLMEHGVEPPPECNRRMIGAFWWHKTHLAVVHYPGTLASSGGMSTGLKVGLGAAAAGATILAVSHGGSADTPAASSVTSTTSTATTPTTPTTSAFNPTAWNGTWKGDMSLKTDAKTCANSQATFGETITISLNASGAGPIVLTDSPGFTRTYNVVITSAGTVTVTTTTAYFGSQVPGSMTITFGGTASAPTLTMTEASTFGACTNTYGSISLGR